MGKDTEWKFYFQDNRRYADVIKKKGILIIIRLKDGKQTCVKRVEI